MLKALFNKAPFATASVMLVLFAAGCASKPVDRGDLALAASAEKEGTSGRESIGSSLSLIARDFAYILPQVAQLRPEQITLTILPNADNDADFAEALRQALFQEGYSVRIGAGNYTSENLTFQIREPGQPESGNLEDTPLLPVKIYQLNVGGISLRRRYSQLTDGRVEPLSAMEGRGLDPTAMVVDDSIFRTSGNNSIADSSLNVRPSGMSMTIQSPLPPVIGNSTVAARTAPLALGDTANFRDLGRSNYFNLFREAAVSDSQVLDFANNSSILLPEALANLKLMVASLEGPDNLISVIGTSHGKAPYEGAQEVLARERAIAVRNALLAMGVALDRIYLEASWSESYYDEVLPRRAAVVEVKRLALLNTRN